jgi:hypothetical protein
LHLGRYGRNTVVKHLHGSKITGLYDIIPK